MGHGGPSAVGQGSGQQPVPGCNNWVLRNWDRVGQGISLLLLRTLFMCPYFMPTYTHIQPLGLQPLFGQSHPVPLVPVTIKPAIMEAWSKQLLNKDDLNPSLIEI